MVYSVATDLFEGSLSLLVELAKFNLLDVFLIKLQALTAQYREEIKTSGATINELAEPLPLLGQLIAIKARLLLPQPPQVEDEEVPISLEELERRLKEYERFKTVAQVLAELHVLQHQHFTRTPSAPPEFDEGDAETPSPTVEVGIVDLMAAFARVIEKSKVTVYEIQSEPWTVEMKIEELTLLLTVKRQLSFEEVFSTEKSRLELVVMFLAILELVRRRVCMAVQERHFGEILIVRREAPEGQGDGRNAAHTRA
ncbi:MAG: segregation/condensation protein A [Candidatus Omnitrophica bacterium]|nr:segregation/condensation protein A [Candidatus Omnitrophota bacterium]